MTNKNYAHSNSIFYFGTLNALLELSPVESFVERSSKQFILNMRSKFPPVHEPTPVSQKYEILSRTARKRTLKELICKYLFSKRQLKHLNPILSDV